MRRANMAIELNDKNFDENIKSGITLVDFWAPWCGPCKMMNPVVTKIENNNPDIKVAKVDIDESPSLAQKYNVMSIPTIIIFKDGEPVDQTVGVVPEKAIMAKVNAAK
jgi:thioredoxin 1